MIFDEETSLVFMHIEKTAGSTMFNALSGMFDPDLICPERFEQIGLLPRGYLQKYRLFGAHASVRDFDDVPRPVRFITLLRDPVERSLSLYSFWKSINANFADENRLYGPQLANTLPVEEFFSLENNWRTHATNRYTELLTGELVPRTGKHILEDAGERAEKAIKVLDQFDFVGISELMDQSLDVMSIALDIPKIEIRENINITKNNYLLDREQFRPEGELDLPNSVVDMISLGNASDQIIYDYALKKMTGSDNLVKNMELLAHPNAVVRAGRNARWVSNQNGGITLYGPYIRLRRGSYGADFTFRHKGANRIDLENVRIEVACKMGNETVQSVSTEKREDTHRSTMSVQFEAASIMSNVEFRIFVPQGFDGEISTSAVLRRLSYR